MTTYHDDGQLDANLDAERYEYEVELEDDAAYEREQVRSLSAQEEAEMAADMNFIAFELSERVNRARELVHTALLAAEAGNGLGLLRIDSLLTQALAELGCKRCGKPIPLEHMQSYSICRSRGECASYCEGH